METEEIVSQEWMKNRRGFQEQANLFWNLSMEHAERTHRGEESRSLDEALKNDIRLILGGMAAGLNPEEAGNLRATIQFDISGKQPGQWYFEIKEGNCDFKEGKVENPTLTIHTPLEIWLAISYGELDGAQAFMQKKYTADGDFNLLMRLKSLFASG
jgi:putative sterol carrier protein